MHGENFYLSCQLSLTQALNSIRLSVFFIISSFVLLDSPSLMWCSLDLHNLFELLKTTYHICSGKAVGLFPPTSPSSVLPCLWVMLYVNISTFFAVSDSLVVLTVCSDAKMLIFGDFCAFGSPTFIFTLRPPFIQIKSVMWLLIPCPPAFQRATLKHWEMPLGWGYLQHA